MVPLCGLALAPCMAGCRAVSGPGPSRPLHDHLIQIFRLNYFLISSFLTAVTDQAFFSVAYRAVNIPQGIMVIVRDACGTDHFPASGARKKKLQMKVVLHFHAYVLLYCHLNLKSFSHHEHTKFTKYFFLSMQSADQILSIFLNLMFNLR